MTIQQFIEKAIEGGWKIWFKSYHSKPEYLVDELVKDKLHRILLDPFAWQAVGKVEHHEWYRGKWVPWWKGAMHGMIDALAEGGTISSYLDTL